MSDDLIQGLKCKYFVLNPSSSDDVHAQASRSAILQYAHYMADVNPVLSEELCQWIEHLDLEDNREGK